MAKGNLLQGMGRGKIGDIVLSRSGGQQISRVRNRSPKNPKSNAQCYQRAIMATVMQAYAAGKAIFNHSFEGKSVGQGCMSEFLRLNAKALRNQIATEIDSATSPDDCFGKVVGPGIKVPVPNRYIVSRGSLVNNIMANNGEFINQPTANETVKAWLSRNGFQTDDLLTLVLFAAGNAEYETDVVATFAEDDYRACNVRCDFIYVQLRVKPSAFSSEAAITGATLLSTIFDYTSNRSLPNWATMDVEHGLAVNNLVVANEEMQLGTSGVIRSHENSGLRSNCTMELFDGTGIVDQNYGITYQNLITAWKAGTVQVGDSDLVLEGGGFDGGTSSPTTLTLLTQEAINALEDGDSIDLRLSWNDNVWYMPIIRITKSGNSLTSHFLQYQDGTRDNQFLWATDKWGNISSRTYTTDDCANAAAVLETDFNVAFDANTQISQLSDINLTDYYNVTLAG